MKEKSIKFRESFSHCLETMNDKQAGQFIKAVCDYAFKGKSYTGNDVAIRSSFILVKRVLDIDEGWVKYGKIGAEKSLELRKEQEKFRESQKAQMAVPTITRVFAKGEMVDKIMDYLTRNLEGEKQECCKEEDEKESVANSEKK